MHFICVHIECSGSIEAFKCDFFVDSKLTSIFLSSQPKPYFSYDSDFISEAEIRENQQREECTRLVSGDGRPMVFLLFSAHFSIHLQFSYHFSIHEDYPFPYREFHANITKMLTI